MTEALVVLGGYLLGSMPFGYWLVRLFHGEDVRKRGSGNIGASNVWRVYGRGYGVPWCCSTSRRASCPRSSAAPRRRARRRARRRRGDARPLAAALPRLPEGREDGRDRRRRVLGVAPLVGLSGRDLGRVFLLTRYASVASIVAARRAAGRSAACSASRGR